MEQQYDLTNLMLDDNTFEVLPEGDYRFTVDSYELGYATSDKLPPNTQVISLRLDVPVMDGTMVKHAIVKTNLNVYAKAMFAIRQFAEAIKLMPEKGRLSFNVEKTIGKEGVCALEIFETKNGSEMNRVKMFYPPSKAPLVVANDEAWKKKNDFLEVEVPDDGSLPFEDI